MSSDIFVIHGLIQSKIDTVINQMIDPLDDGLMVV